MTNDRLEIDLEEKIEELEEKAEELEGKYRDTGDEEKAEQIELEWAQKKQLVKGIQHFIDNCGETEIALSRLTFGEREGVADRLSQELNMPRQKLPDGGLSAALIAKTMDEPEILTETETIGKLNTVFGDWLRDTVQEHNTFTAELEFDDIEGN